MTVIELNNIIESVCKFTYYNGSVYEINDKHNIQYPFINFHINYVRSANNLLTVNSTLIYADRLLKDSSNRLQIQSDGIIYLKELINILYNLGVESELNYLITPFSESLNDDTAGNFTTINFVIPDELSDCETY